MKLDNEYIYLYIMIKNNIILLVISFLLTLYLGNSFGAKEVFAASIMNAASTCPPGTATSFNWPHTVSGNDRLLIVTPTNKSPGSTIASSITFNGINLTRQRIWGTFAGDQITTEIWTLVNPPTGTHNIVVTYPRSVEAVCGASSWTGVDQITPIGNIVGAGSSGTTVTSNSVSSVPGETIVDFLTISASATTTATPAISQTQLWTTKGASLLSASSSKAGAATTTSASTTTSWTLSDNQTSIILAVPIKSSAATPRPSLPPAPTISTPACINPGYSGSGVTISWANSGVTWVDIDTQLSFDEPYFHKAVSSVNSTTAPNGFNAFPSGGTLVLDPNLTYSVRTYNGTQNSPLASFNIPACPLPPTPPTGLTVTVVSQTQIDLSWNITANATSYNLERCSGAGCSNFTPLVTITSNVYSDKNLNCASAYSYRVKATNSIGTSNPSSPVPTTTFSCVAAPPPPPPPPPPATTVTKHPSAAEGKINLGGNNDSIYHFTQNLVIDSPDDIVGNNRGVVFTAGNLLISQNNIGSTQEGLVFVVKGNVNIHKDVTRIDAVIISEGTICTAYDGTACLDGKTITPQLTINGSLIALNGSAPIQFRRALTDNSQPAEKINHQVKYLVILRDLLSDTYQKWSEIP